MLFVSSEFIFVFLPFVLLATMFALRCKGRDAGVVVLIIASLFFYGWWKAWGLAVLSLSIGVNYTLSHQIAARTEVTPRRRLLALGVVLNLLALGYFKYRNFFVDNFLAMLGDHSNLGHIIPPLAISFYTFQQIAFLVDTYHAKMGRTPFREYILSVVFFPHLIAGPLLHYRDIIQQFETRFRVDGSTIAAGLPVFAMGMAKKLAIADPIAEVINPLFLKAETQPLEFLEGWVAALGYTAQLYFDFSGYSDMAIGLGLMFGIALPVNFFSPYKSTSIIEFWRRWHITLSSFLRDYLYIPLGGGRTGPVRRYANLLTVMILGGLWHGAAWTFVLWGTLHGTMLVINHIWRGMVSCRFSRLNERLWLVNGTLTFLVVVLGWVLFRAESLQGAVNVISAMMRPQDISVPYPLAFALGLDPGLWFFGDRGVTIEDLFVFLIFGGGAFIIIWFLPNTAEIFRLRGNLASGPRYRAGWGRTALTGGLLCLSMFGIFSAVPSEFLYFRF